MTTNLVREKDRIMVFGTEGQRVDVYDARQLSVAAERIMITESYLKARFSRGKLGIRISAEGFATLFEQGIISNQEIARAREVVVDDQTIIVIDNMQTPHHAIWKANEKAPWHRKLIIRLAFGRPGFQLQIVQNQQEPILAVPAIER